MNDKWNQVDKLKKKRDQLSARIQKLEAAEKARERKRDTRRKILIGAYAIDKAKQEGSLKTLYREVQNYIQREADKSLFDWQENASEDNPASTESAETS